MKPDNAEVREALRERPPLVLFGSYNERMYAAELSSRAMYIPASFPGAIVRRATGTPFMGYAGATYIIQEFCNQLFDALFHILPLATDLDKVDATPTKLQTDRFEWDDEAQRLLEAHVEEQPFLIRISAAKQLRDRVEQEARLSGKKTISADHVKRVLAGAKQPAMA